MVEETFSVDRINRAIVKEDCVVGIQPGLNRFWSWYRKNSQNSYDFIRACEESHAALLRRMAIADVLYLELARGSERDLLFLFKPKG